MDAFVSKINNKILTRWSQIAMVQGQYPTLIVPAEILAELMSLLREDIEFQMDYLVLITGVDYKTRLGCTYLLKSTTNSTSLVVKVIDIDRDQPKVKSVSRLWPTADFHEREIYDLLGIHFEGHPDLRRIFLDDHWVGHPLRKDYSDEVNVIERKL